MEGGFRVFPGRDPYHVPSRGQGILSRGRSRVSPSVCGPQGHAVGPARGRFFGVEKRFEGGVPMEIHFPPPLPPVPMDSVNRRLGLVLVVVLAGCAGIPIGDESTPSPTTSPGSTPSTLDEIPETVVEAESDRVVAVLRNGSTVSEPSVGVYGTSNATVLDSTDGGVYVRVTVTYSYRYTCTGDSGEVDGLTAESIYLVRAGTPELQRVVENVRHPCS